MKRNVPTFGGDILAGTLMEVAGNGGPTDGRCNLRRRGAIGMALCCAVEGRDFEFLTDGQASDDNANANENKINFDEIEI